MFKKFFQKLQNPPAEASAVKNFERAERALIRNDMQAAAKYNAAAAEAFDRMIAETTAAGKDVFPSLLAKAGVTYVRENRFQDAEDVFADVRIRNDKLAEPFIYGGIALVHLGRKADAVRVWKEYHRFTGMPKVMKVLKEQLAQLEVGECALDELTQALAQALISQLKADYRAKM